MPDPSGIFFRATAIRLAVAFRSGGFTTACLGTAALPPAAQLFQNDRDAQLVAHAPDRFDRAFGDFAMRAFEFLAQPANQLFQGVLAHGRRILGAAKEVTQRPGLQGAVLGLNQGGQELLLSEGQSHGLR